jgi:hypothetical protein
MEGAAVAVAGSTVMPPTHKRAAATAARALRIFMVTAVRAAASPVRAQIGMGDVDDTDRVIWE